MLDSYSKEASSNLVGATEIMEGETSWACLGPENQRNLMGLEFDSTRLPPASIRRQTGYATGLLSRRLLVRVESDTPS